MSTGRTGFVVVCATIAAVLSPSEAAAYIDPGTGSILLQLILGGIAGIWLIVKLLRARLSLIVRRWLGKPVVKNKGE